MFTSRRLSVLVLAAVLSGGAHAKADGDDLRISAEVQKQIDQQPSLKFYNITVRSYHHVVYLEGLVDSRMDRSEAGAIARSVPGVQRVYNDLSMGGNGN